jgi:hypothetical protein
MSSGSLSPGTAFSTPGGPTPGPFRYYGSADATSWFCVVLAATHDERLVQAPEPAWRAGGIGSPAPSTRAAACCVTAATAGCFEAQAYHRGSIWPFDSWLGWGGLRAVGRVAEAERVRAGVLSAVDRLGHAPELNAVTLQGEVEPVAAANRVQARTAGAC